MISPFYVSVSEMIYASPANVYEVISDYIHHHPHILPQPYFTGLIVEKGGKGAGTVILASMNVMGMKVNYRLTVTEPEPGRILTETDEAAGVRTTFKVNPVDDGVHAHVTITTEARTSPGIRGWVERLINPPIMRRIYAAELRQLGAYVKKLGK